MTATLCRARPTARLGKSAGQWVELSRAWKRGAGWFPRGNRFATTVKKGVSHV